MTWFTGILLYAIIWWVVLFMVLPWGVRPPERPQEGHAESAPERPLLWRKAAATTVLAALVWLGVYYLIQAEVLVFRGAIPTE